MFVHAALVLKQRDTEYIVRSVYVFVENTLGGLTKCNGKNKTGYLHVLTVINGFTLSNSC